MVFYYHPSQIYESHRDFCAIGMCPLTLAHTRRVLRFPGRSFPEHHAFSLSPSAAPAPAFHGAHHGHAAQVSQVAQPAYLFHETRPFSQLVHLLFTYTEPLSRKTTRRSDCIPVSPSLTRCRPSKPRRTFMHVRPSSRPFVVPYRPLKRAARSTLAHG